jgi:HTH-type transcriptional regulator / antitoxin MqsA
MKCPGCGHHEMVKKTLDETLSYGNQSLTLHEMRGEFCPSCGEGVWDVESYLRYTETQEALVRSGRGDVSADIRRIRKRLKLSQAELAETFGVGKMAFSRYERGATKPPAFLVKILKLIERHPHLLAEIRGVSVSNESLSGATLRSKKTKSEPVMG